MEPFSQLADQALLNLRNNLRDNDNEADSNVSDNIKEIFFRIKMPQKGQ